MYHYSFIEGQKFSEHLGVAEFEGLSRLRVQVYVYPTKSFFSHEFICQPVRQCPAPTSVCGSRGWFRTPHCRALSTLHSWKFHATL